MKVVEIGPHRPCEHKHAYTLFVFWKFFHVLYTYFPRIVEVRRAHVYAALRIGKPIWPTVETHSVLVHDTFLNVNALVFLDIVADIVWGSAQLV